ncbi:MAG: hypothetical protein ACK56I_36260, partial [bacterium]
NFHQKVTFVETLVKHGKVMQNLLKNRSLTRSKNRPFCFTLPPPLEGDVGLYILKMHTLTAAANIKVCVSYIEWRH